MTKYIVSFLLTFTLIESLPAADFREEYCDGDKGVCMIFEQQGKKVNVYFRNKFPYDNPITTINLEQVSTGKNIKMDTPLPLTVVCSGKDTVKAASFSLIDTSLGWNPGLTWFWTYGSPLSNKNEKYPYTLPFEKGKRFRVCQAFNDTTTHRGDFAYSIDWVMPEGTPVCASRNGVVIEVIDKYTGGGLKKEFMDKNNLVTILHDDGSTAQYAHIKQHSSIVKEGDRVVSGDTIAYSGNVGYSESPHLHFCVNRPLSGKKTKTTPFGFITDYSDYEILEKGVFYSYNGISKKKSRPIVDPEDIVICKSIVNYQPENISSSFLADEKFHVYVPLYAKRDHEIEMNICRSGITDPVFRYKWTIKKGWWQTYTDPIDLSKVSNPEGKWRAEIIIDKKVADIKEFTVQR